MASLKFYNKTTGLWEAIKTDSINGVIPNNQSYTAVQGQTTFTIVNGQIADANLLSVFVNGKIRNDITMTNNTTFQFATALTAGDQVYAEWFEVSVPATVGHHATHYVGGQDQIDVTQLNNFTDEVSIPINNAQSSADSANTALTTHKNDTTNPHKVTPGQIGAVPYSGMTDNVDMNGKSIYNGSKEIIKPDSSGAVSLPNQPMIMNSIDPSWSNMVANTEYTIPYNVNVTGMSSLINNTGIFTAPIAGMYYISASLYLNVTGGAVRLNLYKNNTFTYQFAKYTNTSNSTVEYVIRGDCLLYLNKGDTIKITSSNDSQNWNLNSYHSLLIIMKMA
jgi:hypothetical protein